MNMEKTSATLPARSESAAHQPNGQRARTEPNLVSMGIHGSVRVSEHGASGDGKTLNTRILQGLIDELAA
ncbi:MAG: hypothetical protein WCH98_19925, partial [Verrucomicrobiota bacterium]